MTTVRPLSDSATSTPTISERLADHVVGLRYDDLPRAVVDKAKDLLAYALATALRGRGYDTGRQAVAVAHVLSGDGGPCSIVGDHRRADLLEAVLANSALMQCSGLQDYSSPGMNGGVVVQPVAWALGEMAHAPGREVLTALVAGYDVMATLLGPVWGWGPDVNRPPNSVLGPFGGAAVAGRLLGLDRQQTVAALGHAGQASMGLFEGAVHRWIVYPLLARNGVMAATLARAGFPASPTIVEGPRGVYQSYFTAHAPDDANASLAHLGDEFAVLDVEMRRYPASILNHLPIDLARHLLARHALTPECVAGVELVVPDTRAQREAFYGVGAGSPLYLMALVLAGHDVSDPRHSEQAPAGLDRVIDRMRLRFEPGHPRRYARVEITTTDGQIHVAGGDAVEPAAPFDPADRLRAWGRQVLGDERATRLAQLVGNVEEVADVSDLFACVVTDEQADEEGKRWPTG